MKDELFYIIALYSSIVNAAALGALEVTIAKPIPIATIAMMPIITQLLIFLFLIAFLACSSRSFDLIFIRVSDYDHINDLYKLSNAAKTYHKLMT
jgi:hypothetical protein